MRDGDDSKIEADGVPCAEEGTDGPTTSGPTLKRRVAELTVGYSASYAINAAFDYLLYPLVIYKLGVLKGGLVMTLLAFVANVLTLKFYDWSKRDWLGIEALKGVKEYEGKSRFGRFVAWLMRKSDLMLMVFLSIKEDAFITVVYMRHGSHQYNGMTPRDWKIFLASLAIANIYWTIAAFMGVSLVEWGWRQVGVWSHSG